VVLSMQLQQKSPLLDLLMLETIHMFSHLLQMV